MTKTKTMTLHISAQRILSLVNTDREIGFSKVKLWFPRLFTILYEPRMSSQRSTTLRKLRKLFREILSPCLFTFSTGLSADRNFKMVFLTLFRAKMDRKLTRDVDKEFKQPVENSFPKLFTVFSKKKHFSFAVVTEQKKAAVAASAATARPTTML